MRVFAGVDVHRGFCQTTVMDGSGAIVERAKIPTDTEHLRAFFERYRGAQAVIESNTIALCVEAFRLTLLLTTAGVAVVPT